jgi:hypothetical protein
VATESWLDSGAPQWDALLAEAALADTYHGAAYHRIAEVRGEGEPRLFVWRDGSAWAALPLLLRPIPGGSGRRDAGCVYGYAGPFSSSGAPHPDFSTGFREALAVRLGEEGLVSVMARLHPLLDQALLLRGLGDIRPVGDTVSIDLHVPEEQQLAGYRSNHRRDLRRLERDGFVTGVDKTEAGSAAFIEIYHANMRRVGAPASYYFDNDYFERLHRGLGSGLDLFICRFGDAIVGGAYFMRRRGIVQYHLGAVADAYLAAAPLKQLLDAARRHYAQAGAAVLHLGGGRGGCDDSLFRFKAGFSGRRHRFAIWCLVVDGPAYEGLVGDAAPTSFFPRYRAPVE